MNLTAPELEKIITLLFTQALLFGGGLLTTYFKLKSSAAKREESIKESIASKVEEMKLHQDMSMQKLNGMLTYLIHSFGRPAWLKVARMSPCGEIEFRMLEVNDDYAATFGISRLAYIGKTDLEAGWPWEAAQEFRKHDLSVWASGEPVTVTEHHGTTTSRFRKVRVQSANGELKGIFGYCIDCGDPHQCPVQTLLAPPHPN